LSATTFLFLVADKDQVAELKQRQLIFNAGIKATHAAEMEKMKAQLAKAKEDHPEAKRRRVMVEPVVVVEPAVVVVEPVVVVEVPEDYRIAERHVDFEMFMASTKSVRQRHIALFCACVDCFEDVDAVCIDESEMRKCFQSSRHKHLSKACWMLTKECRLCKNFREGS
jgi:hypothetical protein